MCVACQSTSKWVSIKCYSVRNQNHWETWSKRHHWSQLHPWPLTSGCFRSLGLMHRMKYGWQALSAFIRASSDWRNWPIRVGERFLPSGPSCQVRGTKSISALQLTLSYLSTYTWLCILFIQSFNSIFNFLANYLNFFKPFSKLYQTLGFMLPCSSAMAILDGENYVIANVTLCHLISPYLISPYIISVVINIHV